MPKTIIYDPVSKRFAQINDPPKVKPLEVVLTDEEEERVIKEFKEIFTREPTEEEREELFSEELKIKQEGLSNANSCSMDKS